MKFTIEKSIEIIERTPKVLLTLLKDLSSEWTEFNEGENTWTAKEIIAHLIICEQTDWIPRARIILSDGIDKAFVPLDMAAHFELATNNSLDQLLMDFQSLRMQSIGELLGYNLSDDDYTRTAMHPKIGEVNLAQLIATWVTHDLAHIAQIARVIAKQNAALVGPFKDFLKILNQ